MKSELEKFRTRWLRWLGQKTRYDKPMWVTLLDSNWQGWASSVLEKHSIDIDYPLAWHNPTREEVKLYYFMAICAADMKDLMRLDELYCCGFD